MGLLGRRVAGAAAPQLARRLARAAADEWHAHYNFRFAAQAVRGHRSPSVLSLFTRLSDDALARADALGERIHELGGQPPRKLADVVDAASDKPFKLPRRMDDVDGVLRAVLDACRTSIKTYDVLGRRADAVTAAMAGRFLADAIRDEEELERLLGQTAPGLTGG